MKQRVLSCAQLVTYNGVEEGGLADVGQADDAGAEAHANLRVAARRVPPRAAAADTPAPLPAQEER